MKSITSEEAVSIYREIRENDFAHKEGEGQALCEARADKVARVLRDVYGIQNVKKLWVYAVDSEGNRSDITSPLPAYEYIRRLQTDGALVKYNHHVAPLVETSDGRELIFDTRFYNDPPESVQWLADFPASDLECTQKYVETNLEPYLFVRDVLGQEDPNVALGYLDRFKKNLAVSFELWSAPQRRLSDGGLKAIWRTNLREPVKVYESGDTEVANDFKYNGLKSPVLSRS